MHTTNDTLQQLEQLELSLRCELMQLIKEPLQATEVAKISMKTPLGNVIDYLSQIKLSNTNTFAKLMRLEAAYCQLELGLYGICSDCEKEIEPLRLIADPTEQRCAKCEQKFLREHRHELRLNH